MGDFGQPLGESYSPQGCPILPPLAPRERASDLTSGDEPARYMRNVAVGGWVKQRPRGSGEQLHVGVRQHPLIAERAAEQVRGHDRHALHVQAAAVDMGAVHAHHRGSAGAEQPADDRCLPADRLQDAIQPVVPVVVVPGQPVGALADAAGSLLGVDYEHP